MSRLRRPRGGFWIRLCVIIIYPVVGAVFRIRFRDLDRMPAPETGGVIVAANHVAQIDTMLMARLVWQSGRIPRFMIKAGVFGWPVVGAIMRGAGQIPVQRGTDDAARSLDDAAAALRAGEAVVIYPEGTTTKDRDSWPMQGRTGVARLALLAPGIPVVPVAQWGPQRRRPLRVRLRRRTAESVVGPPVDLTRFARAEPDAHVLREMTDVIMTAIRDQVAAIRGETPPREFHVPQRRYVDRG